MAESCWSLWEGGQSHPQEVQGVGAVGDEAGALETQDLTQPLITYVDSREPVHLLDPVSSFIKWFLVGRVSRWEGIPAYS